MSTVVCSGSLSVSDVSDGFEIESALVVVSGISFSTDVEVVPSFSGLASLVTSLLSPLEISFSSEFNTSGLSSEATPFVDNVTLFDGFS